LVVGVITLMEGDCLRRMAEIPAGSVDMVLADLPYGVSNSPWDSVIPLAPLWDHYRRVLKPAGAVVLTACQPFTSMLVTSNPAMFRYDLVWDKVGTTGFANAKRMPLRRHESILVFYRKQPTYRPAMEVRGKPRNKGGSKGDKGVYRIAHSAPSFNNTYYPTSIIAVSNASKRGIVHPNQKPVQLLERLVCTYTDPDDTVLDNAMGSGSTGVACLNTGRRFIGIEGDPAYFAIARDRIEAARPLVMQAAE
jgi:site-specific DNA-methyltransferase (adenine-specific)